MGVGAVVLVEQTERLEKFAWPTWQLRGETDDSGAAGLLGDAQHTCTLMLRGGGAGQQQGAAAGDDQPFATHRQATLISACKPPAPVTPGSVQPGNGSNNSRAPVQRIKRS